MEQGRYSLDGLRETKRLPALEDVVLRTSTLLQRGMRSRLLHWQVPTCPLLH